MAGTNTPNLNLYKPSRTDNVSVIADLNDNMDKIDTFAGNVATAESNSKGTVAIVEDGNTCTHVGGIASGQYVVWKGLLYKATQAISVGTTLSTSTNLSAVTDGIANELNSKISSSRADATPNTTYVDSGAIHIYSIGNVKLIEFSDIKFKASLPSSSASNQIALFTLPFTIASAKSEIFILTKLDSTPTTVRLMAKDNVITPWWSSIGVTSGEGFFGSVVCSI